MPDKTIYHKSKDFVHLHLHTNYSLLRSAIQLKPLAKRLNELEMRACAITDYGNMFGAISFYSTMRANGIIPIIGYEANVIFKSRFEKSVSLSLGENPYYHLVLLARNYEGYLNLCYMASKAYTEGFHHKPRVDLELLSKKSSGLIGLSSGLKGVIGHNLAQENFNKALEKAKLFEDILGSGNFFLEIQDHGLEEEQKLRKSLIELSKKSLIPVVATNDVHYLNRSDSKAQEMLLCISEGKTIEDSTRERFGSDTFYLRSAEEMWEIFGNELPDSLTKTLEISERCRIDIPTEGNLALPEYPIPPDSGCKTIDEYFEQVVYEGFKKRKGKVWNSLKNKGELKHAQENYKSRVKDEIKIIKDMGFSGYFLTVWDFIKYAREKGIPIGPGRGSAAGSLVAYCMEITDIDPIQYDLLFERFLNPERISMPDIDIDFCVRRRAEVIDYVTNFYGKDSVCQIITFGTMASRASIRDVGRALNLPYAKVEKIVKLIPPPFRGRNISISQAIKQVPELKEAIKKNSDVKEVVDLAKRLEGCARHTSVHAAGVVISPKALHKLMPITVSSRNNDELTSQYPMDDLETVGLLKMDFLALNTLTIISDCLKHLKRKSNIDIDWGSISLTDEKTMKLFGEGKTDAIFQFESSGMQEICKKLKPKELEDLAALNALYRPGPLDGGMVDDFIARHRRKKKVRYIVSEMKDILKNTHGILVYQEQIMQIAQKLAGYSLSEADMMRRAMGKKKRSEMAVHEEKFIEGAVSNGIKRTKAEEIYKLMAQFADYGFNRSHSVAYAYVAYQTAYLKAHYPAYFYAAVLSNEIDNTAKIYKYATDLKASGLSLLPPDVNESDSGFTPLNKAIRFGLSAIKGIGFNSVKSIIAARKSGGKFISLFDFTSRLEQGDISRRGLESLVSAGAFDSMKSDNSEISLWRTKLHAAVKPAISHAQRIWDDKRQGQSALFKNIENEKGFPYYSLPNVAAWSHKEFSRHEKDAIGFYLSTHPLDQYKNVLRDLKIKSIVDFFDVVSGTEITISGMVSRFKVKYSRKGNRFCIFRLEDQSGGVKCLAWSEALSRFAEILENDRLLVIEGKVEANDGKEITLIVNNVRKLSDMAFQNAAKLSVTLPDNGIDVSFLENIVSLLSAKRGSCEVCMELKLENGITAGILVESLRIKGSDALEAELKKLGCSVSWDLG